MRFIFFEERERQRERVYFQGISTFPCPLFYSLMWLLLISPGTVFQIVHFIASSLEIFFLIYDSWSVVETMLSYHAYWMDRDALLTGFSWVQRQSAGPSFYRLSRTDLEGGVWLEVSSFLCEAILVSVNPVRLRWMGVLCGTTAAGCGCLQLQSGLPSFRVLQSGSCWVTSVCQPCPSRYAGHNVPGALWQRLSNHQLSFPGLC